MIVEVRLFARARELIGSDSVALDLPQGATVAELRTRLSGEFPRIRPIAPSLLVAVGNDYVSDSTPLVEDDQVVCFPPVSGG